ncbi:hypothetical protein EPB39_14710 [Listeria monocytogenes]|nr:hypothetical protein [Listeria monocytogenes]EAC2200794.1 hypothetical protein [Listeria monocytogenes]EAC5692153.1 hypothetical protein [Listeria monocytogenes]EAC7184381.1 hypothetical protein [Listeria monocytogenes]EAC8921518.1 hypothetical protein [Listeria monocytogenes]
MQINGGHIMLKRLEGQIKVLVISWVPRDVQNKSQGNRELHSTLYFLAIQQIYLTNKGEPRNLVFRVYFERKVLDAHIPYKK